MSRPGTPSVWGRIVGGTAGVPANRRAQLTIIAVAALSVAAIGVLDSVTGIWLSLSVFYLLPVITVTVAVSAAAGIVFAAGAATTWVVADAVINHGGPSAAVQVWNGVLRFVVFSVVVLLVAALRDALDTVQRSDQRSKEFLAYAAHQLRTPIAAVRASAEALVLGPCYPHQEQLVANIATEAGRMGRLVASLLRLTRLDQGEPLETHRTALVEVLEAEVDRFRPLAPQVDFRLEVDAALPRLVFLDGVATAEILANLLDNARRHAATTIVVTAYAPEGQLRIVVADDGPGLPAGAEETAFERFVSLDGRGGSGLGLAIGRALAEAQRGSLRYTTNGFVLTLPLLEARSSGIFSTRRSDFSHP